MTEWEACQLGNIGRVVTGKTPPTADPSNYGGVIPFVTPTDMDGRRTISRTLRYLSNKGMSSVRSSYVQGPAITVSCIGSDMGKSALVFENYVSNQQINSICPLSEYDLYFIYYNLSGRREEIRGLAGGAAQPILNKGDFSRLPIQVPPLDEQREIGRVLKSLDDKIELNRRMNETLEGIAQAIFRDWFVDFGPVRRKQAGSTDPVEIMGAVTPSVVQAAKLAGLFPDAFDDNALPKGWRSSDIYEHAAVVYGAPFASSKFNSKGLGRPLIRIRDLANHGSDVSTDELHRKEHLIRPGDIVVGMDGEFRARLWHGVPSLMNQRVCSFVPKHASRRAFVFYSIKPILNQFEQTAVGTTVIHLGKRDIDSFSTIYPGNALLHYFGELVEPLLSRAVTAGLENRTLAETRDYLLPRLMSGAVRVGEVASASEVAA